MPSFVEVLRQSKYMLTMIVPQSIGLFLIHDFDFEFLVLIPLHKCIGWFHVEVKPKWIWKSNWHTALTIVF